MRHLPILENDKVTRVFISDTGQFDKRSIAKLKLDKIIPKGNPLANHHRLNAAV